MKSGTGKKSQSAQNLTGKNHQTRGTVRDASMTIQESEERFRTIFDSINDAIFIHDLDTGAILDVNRRMCEMYGFTREEALQLRASDSSAGEPPYTEEDALNWIRKAATDGPQTFEWHAKHKTGRLFWVEVSMRRALIGTEERLLGTVHDMTDRKKVEASLQECEKAVEGSQDMIATVDRSYRYRFVNAAFLRYRGMNREEIIGRSAPSILGKGFFEKVVKENLDRCFRGETVHYEIKQAYAGLGEKHLLVSYFPINGAAGVERVTAVIRDMTEQRRTEAALKESEAKYRNIFDNAAMGIFQSTPDGRYLRANAASARTYGFDSPEEMINSVTDIAAQQYVDPNDRTRLKEACAAHGFVEGFETQMFRKDGSRIWVSANVRVVRDGKGDMLYFEGTHHDITSRKKAEEELYISRNRLSKAELISRSGNWEFDLESKRVFCSEGAREVYGLLDLEWTIPEVQKIPLPEYRGMLDRAAKDLIEEDRPYDVEFKIRRPDSGEIIDIHSVAEYDRNRNAVFGIIQDITARKKTEEALRKSEEQYRCIVETTGEGISALDQDFIITFVNKRFTEMVGYATDELIGMSLFSLMFKEDVPDALEKRRERKPGESDQFERRFRRKDGSTLWVYASVTRMADEEDRFSGSFSMYIDITEQKRAEEALRERETEYRRLFENAPVGIFHSTPEGRYLRANPSLALMLRYDSAEDLVSSVSNIAEQIYADPGARSTIFSDILKTESWVFAENRYRCKDGTMLIGKLAARKELNPNGTIKYLEGFLEDLTARRVAEEEKELLESQLRQSQKMEAIGTLAGGVAHDFNNILMAIIGFASVLQMDLEKGDPKSTYVDQILASAERAANLTQSLLAFSRKQRISPKSHKINDVIAQTTELLKRLLPEDIELKVTLAHRNPAILADTTQIDQILINLATNARDAMPRGGILSIETGVVTLDEEFSALRGYSKSEEYALISVSDNGTGMDEKTKERIFEPFFTTKEVGKGTGLGLSSVYGIVKQHNGFIAVESAPNEGTTFRIFFTMAGGTEETQSLGPAQAQKGTETILVAEDDPGVRMLVADILGRYGYTTIEASDGEDALKKFIDSAQLVSLIIMDVVMPRRSGKEVYEEAKRISPNVKVLFTSGYTRDAVVDRGIEEGTVDFVEKPIIPHVFLNKVRQVLDSQ
jgi:PAS domain S-box-containing protein